MAKLYGTVYHPLTVTVTRFLRGGLGAFIGKQMCIFEPGSQIPKIGQSAHVMISRARFHLFPQDHQLANMLDLSRLQVVVLRIIDPSQHTLVAIDGFTRQGSRRITARGHATDGDRPLTSAEVYPRQKQGESDEDWKKRSEGSFWLTPGRCGVIVADHPREAVPTNVWVETASIPLHKKQGVKVVGLTRIQDAQWASLVEA